MGDDGHADEAVARVAAAIGEPARSRILYCLMDGRARTGTELSVVAEVAPSTASAHFNRLVEAGLIKVLAEGKRRYYSLAGGEVAHVLESLSVLAGRRAPPPATRTPPRLRAARTCYDHLAGEIAVRLHERLQAMGWLVGTGQPAKPAYDLTAAGREGLEALGVDVAAASATRRRFAFGCLDWSERRPHLGGALGAAFLDLALRREWVIRDLDSRALELTGRGRRDLAAKFGVAA
jgi:DNA-binding transcriptional ArsR family regulator